MYIHFPNPSFLFHSPSLSLHFNPPLIQPTHLPPHPHSLTLQLPLHNSKRILQQIHLLLHMTRLQPCRHTRTRVPARIHDMLPAMMHGLIQQRLNPRLREAPRARIQRLLLAPNDRLGVLVHIQVFF